MVFPQTRNVNNTETIDNSQKLGTEIAGHRGAGTRPFPVTTLNGIPFSRHSTPNRLPAHTKKLFVLIHQLMPINRLFMSSPYPRCLNYRDNHSSVNLSVHWVKISSCTTIVQLLGQVFRRARLEFIWTARRRLLSAVAGNDRALAPRGPANSVPSFWVLSTVAVLLTFLVCAKTISYVIKQIKMIADALVPWAKLTESQFVTFAEQPLGVQRIFLTVICAQQSCLCDKSIAEWHNHAS